MTGPLVTPAMYAKLRGIGNRQLVTDVTIQRKTETDTAYGSQTSFVTVATVKGWLRMMNKPHMVEQTGFIGASGMFRLHVPQGTDLREGDQVHIGDRDYLVNDVNDDDSIQIYTTALVRRIE